MGRDLYLLLTVAFLVAALIVVLALGWYDNRSADRLANELDAVRADLVHEQAKTRHLTERVAEYRTELARLSADNGELMAALTCEPTLTESVLATIADLPLTDPEDFR